MNLQVLLVEDNEGDMKTYLRDLPGVFAEFGLQSSFHAALTFEDAAKLISDGSRRFDLILSDTYRGNFEHRDAAVIDMVNNYRGARFCPLVVFSASSKPDQLKLGSFVIWADKSVSGGIEEAIRRMLRSGIPQAARQMHDELDRLAGSYLWEFLENNWERLESGGHVQGDVLSRLIRRRAALQLAEITYAAGTAEPVTEVSGLEFYAYPPLQRKQFSLGEIIRKKDGSGQIRVILTPHCYLTIQQNQTCPRAEYVKTVKTVLAKDVLGAEKLNTARAGTEQQQAKKLRSWVTPPSGQDVGKPEGRYWFLPAFLDIPHLYCDFLQVETVPYANLQETYESLAVLSPPYAESLQACYVAFHASVGIPNVKPASIAGLLNV